MNLKKNGLALLLVAPLFFIQNFIPSPASEGSEDPAEIKVFIKNPGTDQWEFEAGFDTGRDVIADVAVRPEGKASALLTLTRAGAETGPGPVGYRRSVLRVTARQRDLALEKELNVLLVVEGIEIAHRTYPDAQGGPGRRQGATGINRSIRAGNGGKIQPHLPPGVRNHRYYPGQQGVGGRGQADGRIHRQIHTQDPGTPAAGKPGAGMPLEAGVTWAVLREGPGTQVRTAAKNPGTAVKNGSRTPGKGGRSGRKRPGTGGNNGGGMPKTGVKNKQSLLAP
jgi:hypothetical protein